MWTKEKEQAVIDLRVAGESFSAIAKMMGPPMTRSAVAGKIYRIRDRGIVKEYVVTKHIAKEGVHAHVCKLRAHGWSYSTIETRFGIEISKEDREVINTKLGLRIKSPNRFKFDKFVVPDRGFTYDLIDIEHDMCRFPSGDGPFKFCGGKIDDGHVYCKSCRKIAYRREVSN